MRMCALAGHDTPATNKLREVEGRNTRKSPDTRHTDKWNINKASKHSRTDLKPAHVTRVASILQTVLVALEKELEKESETCIGSCVYMCNLSEGRKGEAPRARYGSASGSCACNSVSEVELTGQFDSSLSGLGGYADGPVPQDLTPFDAINK